MIEEQLIGFNSYNFSTNQTVESAKYIKIIVKPIDKMSETTFDHYFSILRQFNEFSHKELDLRLLKNKNLAKGKVFIEFVKSNYITSKWETFEPHRQIFGLLATVDAKQTPNLNYAYKQYFNELTKLKESSLVGRCLVFHCGKETVDLEIGDMLLISNELRRSELEKMLKKFVLNFVSNLVVSFNLKIHQIKKDPKIIVIPSDFDFNSGGTHSNVIKKYQKGRKLKTIADLYLLSGFWDKAEERYQEVIDLSRFEDDLIYQAGSIQNLSCINTIKMKEKGISLYSKEYLQTISNNLQTAIMKYSKKNKYLQAETQLKLARFFLEYGGVKERGQAIAILQMVFLHRKVLQNDDKVLLLLGLASLYEFANMKRKFGFFLREIASSLHQQKKTKLSHDFLLYASKYFQLEGLIDIITGNPSKNYHKMERGLQNQKNETKNKKITNQQRWVKLQQSLIFELILLAKELQDNLKVITYIIYGLKIFHNKLSKQQQIFFSRDLRKYSKFIAHDTHLNMIGIPKIIDCKIIPYNIDEIPIEKEKKSDDVFIFMPFLPDSGEGKNIEPIVWAENEIINISLTFANPFFFDLEIDEIVLLTDHTNQNSSLNSNTSSLSLNNNDDDDDDDEDDDDDSIFQSFPISAIIPSKSTNFEVIVSGKPIKSNIEIKIINCKISIFNIAFIHPIKLKRSIKVIDSLPKLAVTKIDLDKLSLFNGEETITFLQFHNQGSKKITDIQINKSITKSDYYKKTKNTPYEQFYCSPLIDFNQEIIDKNLPFEPGNQFYLPLKFSIREFVDEIVLKIVYQTELNNKLNFCRGIKIKFLINYRPGVSLQSFEILRPNPSFYKKQFGIVNQSNSFLVLLDIKNNGNTLFKIYCWLDNNIVMGNNRDHKDDNNDNDGNNKNSIDKEVIGENINKNKTNELNVQNNNSFRNFLISTPKKYEGNFDSWARKLLKKKKKTILKSIKKKNNINFFKKFTCEAQSSIRIIIPMSGFQILKNPQSKIPFRKIVENYVQLTHNRPTSEDEKMLLRDLNVKSWFLERLQLYWVSEYKNIGKVLLHSLEINQTHLNLLQPPFLSLNLSIQKNELDNKIILNHFHLMKLSIKNNHLKNVLINFKINVKYGGSIINPKIISKKHSNKENDYEKIENLDSKILWLGTFERKNILINSNYNFEHQVYISFLVKGRYILDVKFYIKDKKMTFNLLDPIEIFV
ncbi:trafficking protein particle complex subunit [Anaeramoeba flamelloides]|uniref:Trafficking protein particle complex subunit n=1 Tax=Anaeramoeba flamelloides TaxID=1746091 RepID=A0AAV7Y836_9EUKA|nr:trafficking protein particle complex subunit [Anaeramoeba flamelloides]